MQNKYVGDIGDYVKLAILRTVAPNHTLGVAWWLHPDELQENNGRHTDYLNDPVKWRHYDPDLFDCLVQIALSDGRSVGALEAIPLLSEAKFHKRPLLIDARPEERRRGRTEWFEDLKAELADCDTVFVDPDNGLEPGSFSAGSRAGGKSVGLAELKELDKPGRTLIVYHHQTRRKGGHSAELRHWAARLTALGFKTVDAIRSKPYSPRAFFFLNARPAIRERAKKLVRRWHPQLTWHPHVEPAADAARAPTLT